MRVLRRPEAGASSAPTLLWPEGTRGSRCASSTSALSPYHSPLEVETFDWLVDRPGQPRPRDARLRRGDPPRRGRRCRPRARRPGAGRGGQHPRHAAGAGGGLPGPSSTASSTARPPGSTATAPSRRSMRKPRSRRRATSTPRPSSPARPTAPATGAPDLEFTILRFGIPYGPRARAAGVVAKFTDLSFEGKALTIAGDGSTTRSFIYVEDLADGIVAALAPGRRGPHLQPLRRRDHDDPRNRRAGPGKRRHLRDHPHAPRPGDFPGKTISNQRALDELGWKAERLQGRRPPVRRMGQVHDPPAGPDPRHDALDQRQRPRRRGPARRRVAPRRTAARAS